MCDFQPGEEVICVDASILIPNQDKPPLVVGKTYVVLHVMNLPGHSYLYVGTGVRDGWRPERFRRPLIDEADTDLREALKVWGPQALVGRQFKVKVNAR